MSSSYDDDDDIGAYDEDAGGYTIETFEAAEPDPHATEAAESASALDLRGRALPPEQAGMGTSSEYGGRAPGGGGGQPPPGMMVRASGGKHGPSCNTGPKGVKEDFKEAQRNLRTQRMMERIGRERMIKGQTTANIDLSSLEISKQQYELERKQQQYQQKKQDQKQNDSESDEDEDSDDEAFTAYKLSRIQTLQNSLPVFGSYDRITKQELLSLPKSIHEHCYLVVHLYQNHIEACVRLHFSLQALATQFTHVKFVRIRSTEAIPNYSEAGLPTLMIYKNGAMVTSAVRVTDGLGKTDFGDLDVAKLLQSKGILSLPTGYEELEKKKEELRKEKMKFQEKDGGASNVRITRGKWSDDENEDD